MKKGSAIPVLCCLVLLGCISSVGCANLFSTVMYAVGADLQPAECETLEGKRTAVVVVTEGTNYRDDIASRILSREISAILEAEVKGIELVREEEIDDWRDNNDWDQLDFAAIGKGVKAEKVVGIEVSDLKLREGQTLYRGRASVTTTVYDMKTETREFRRHLDDFAYPLHAGQYTSETTEPKFRRRFLAVLSRRLARYFHRWDPRETVALDAAIVNL